jgi:hypothetical protein
MSNSSVSSNSNNKQYSAAYSNSPTSLIFSSTPPFSDLLHNTNTAANSNSNNPNKPKLLNPIYSNNGEFNHMSSSPNNITNNNRCNQNVDLNKFKKNGEKTSSQKVSV